MGALHRGEPTQAHGFKSSMIVGESCLGVQPCCRNVHVGAAGLRQCVLDATELGWVSVSHHLQVCTHDMVQVYRMGYADMVGDHLDHHCCARPLVEVLMEVYVYLWQLARSCGDVWCWCWTGGVELSTGGPWRLRPQGNKVFNGGMCWGGW